VNLKWERRRDPTGKQKGEKPRKHKENFFRGTIVGGRQGPMLQKGGGRGNSKKGAKKGSTKV